MLFILVLANPSQASVYCSNQSQSRSLFMFPIVIECNMHWACVDSPIDECNILQTSLDALDMFDMFDLCLLINCKICLDLDYCLAD